MSELHIIDQSPEGLWRLVQLERCTETHALSVRHIIECNSLEHLIKEYEVPLGAVSWRCPVDNIPARYISSWHDEKNRRRAEELAQLKRDRDFYKASLEAIVKQIEALEG